MNVMREDQLAFLLDFHPSQENNFKNALSLNRAIRNGFEWASTEEGGEYWGYIASHTSLFNTAHQASLRRQYKAATKDLFPAEDYE